MGDRGRFVLPADLRERHGLLPGSPMLLLDTPGGVVLMSRQEAKNWVRSDLAGLPLVEELLAERRQEAASQ